LEQLSYGTFSAALRQRQAGERVPLQVSIEVTRRCPLECLHCYNKLAVGDKEAKSRELSKEEHLRFLDELVEMGCFWILYTGGEIFARKDFLEIYTYAKKKGVLITLFTNGTIINEQIADYLAEWPPFAIEISLYGRSRETYEALTAVPGSYDRFLRGIQLQKDRGLPLKLKTVATSVNKHDIFDTNSVNSLTNGSQLPVFLIMDCLNEFFEDVYAQPLGVTLLLAPNGGAVGVLASSGLNQPSLQTPLDALVVQGAMNGQGTTLGDAIAKAKSHNGDLDVRRTFVLLGDPAMQVKQPTQAATGH
jgi:uncharacterized Fe-S cluster-containing radical SAM superfamily protein